MKTKPTFRILFCLNMVKKKDTLAPIYTPGNCQWPQGKNQFKKAMSSARLDDHVHRLNGRNLEATSLNKYLEV